MGANEVFLARIMTHQKGKSLTIVFSAWDKQLTKSDEGFGRKQLGVGDNY